MLCVNVVVVVCVVYLSGARLFFLLLCFVLCVNCCCRCFVCVLLCSTMRALFLLLCALCACLVESYYYCVLLRVCLAF